MIIILNIFLSLLNQVLIWSNIDKRCESLLVSLKRDDVHTFKKKKERGRLTN